MNIQIPIAISGTGAFVPEEVITNQYYVERLETTDEWITTRTGIRERRRVAEGDATSDLAIRASLSALENAGLKASDLDAIICATATGDHTFPATATFVQAGLDVENTPAFDIAAACAGFLYGCAAAAAFIGSTMYKRVLVVGAESLTRYADPEDRTTVVIFGDGAGAAILEHTDEDGQGILYSKLGCDGKKANLILVPAGGARLPSSAVTVAERLQYLHMRGREVYKFAVLKMQELIDDALKSTGLTPDDLAMVIPHQSNLRIIESVREKMGLSREKIAINIDRYGNTSAASIPMALDEAIRCGRLKQGDLILTVGIGAGLTWSAMIIRL
ncbi:MAG: beta-ketoacyl-ACP synthase III [Planctomycetota bacterium]|jgi:3-oxoacyl-[acyl-carrier-protein] synthase-3